MAPSEGPPRPDEDPAEAAEAKLDWKAKAQENYDLFLRARADYENLARRSQRDLATLVRRDKRAVFLKLLELADNLERAEAAWQRTLSGCRCPGLDPQALVGGVNMISRQLANLLAAEGVRPIEARGCAFDPGRHECVATWENPEVAGETVTDEVRRGYTFDGEVLRAAQVRVAIPPGR